MNLEHMIIRCKALGKSIFRVYEHSGMGTQKWNPLDHLVDAITHVAEYGFFVEVCTNAPIIYSSLCMQIALTSEDSIWMRP